MRHLLSEAGRSFLRAFAGSLLILLPGVLAAPDMNQVLGLATAAIISSVVAGLKAIQVFVPQLSFSAYLPGLKGALLDSFARAFLGSFVVLLQGVLASPDFDTGKAALIAALIAAVTAGIRAVQGLFTSGEEPAPNSGF